MMVLLILGVLKEVAMVIAYIPILGMPKWALIWSIIMIGKLLAAGIAIKFFIGFFKYKRTSVNERNDTHRVALVDNWLWGYAFFIVLGAFPAIAFLIGEFTIGGNYKDS